jgi:hypothetical protein
MSFSNMNFGAATWYRPVEQEPEREDDGTEQARGALGLAADAGHEFAEHVAHEYHTVANDLVDLGGQLQRGAQDLGLELNDDFRGLEEDLKDTAGEYRAAGEEAEHLGKTLGRAGKFLGAVDAIEGAYDTFKHSDAKTLAGKLADGAIGGGSHILAGANLPIAAADLVTHGEVSKFFHAGGKAILAIGSAVTGDLEPAAKFNEGALKGDYGLVAEGISRGERYLFSLGE